MAIRKVASNLLLHEGRFVRNPLVEFDDQSGEILSVEWDVKDIDRVAGVEFYSGLMCAGFVNMHSHLELSYLKGAIAEGGGFAAFAGEIGAIRSSERFTDEDRARAIERADLEMQSEGIIAVADIVNGATSFGRKSPSSTKIEYHNFAEIFGLKTNNLKQGEELLKERNTSLTQHSTYSLNDKIFKEIANQNIENPLSIHFMESQGELELYEGRGALHDWYQSMGFEVDFLGYGSPAGRIVASVPKDRSVILVHNCFVRREDIDLIMNHFTAELYWVLCPESNRYISGITPPVELLKEYRTEDGRALNICLGTDSLASATSLSILEQIRLLQSEKTELCAMLNWATFNGAKALGFNHLGAIEVGKKPGINIISGIDYQTMQLTHSSRITPIKL